MTDQNAPGQNAADQDPSDQPAPGPDTPRTETADLRVIVDRIEGRSVCGLTPGDYVEITRSSQLRIPEGQHFCMYALASVLPLLPAKQRALQDGDWLASDSLVACPDPDERLIMRIERIGHSSIPTEELT
ncbi:TIGR04076 family protein [Pseudactinotalea sp. Z1748]|uniref:TIGR04076 family protein n=1 Tax=Pseudactinotalea sp. Z1748 TaxID=3413027 RepID=UPI003C7E3C98